MRIVTAARDPDVDLNHVASLLANDPALAAKTLRVANSSLYGRSRQAQNLRQAVTVLGLNATVTLALSFSLAASLRHVDGERLDLDGYWRRALLSALAARLLGSHSGMRSLEELFLAGLLQDMGVLALDAALQEEYARVFSGAVDHDDLIAREREALAVDHREAGAWLMREWGLPEYLSMAALGSHDLGHRNVPADLVPFVGCVAVSGRIADIYLAADTDAATARAVEAAQACLGVSTQALGDVLAAMSESLAEVEALFEIPVLSASQAAGLTDQAREVLASRNLLLLRSAAQERRREEDFQQMADHLHEVARRDELTGVFNRRHFDEAFTEEFARAEAQEWPLSLAYLDLDHFKTINDHHGHLTGDRILSAVANHIQAQLRQGDLLARYGGEEFVLLMPGINHETAAKVVDRIRTAVERLEHPLDSGETLRVTVSAGVASHLDEQQRRRTPDALLQAADQALYSAKRQGRNRVALSE